MNKDMNRSARVASEELLALANRERAMLDSVVGAIKSAFTNEPDIGSSLSAYKARGAEISHRVLATINRYPLVTALSVVGASCLLYGLRKGASQDMSAYNQSRASYGVDPEYIDEWGEPIPASERFESAAKEKLEEARERADELGPRAREYARSARTRAEQLRHEAENYAQSMGHKSQDLAQRARSTIRQHPVAAGLVGVALGVAVGSALYGSSRKKQSFNGINSRLLSSRDLSRTNSFFTNTSNAAKDAFLNAKNRITH